MKALAKLADRERSGPGDPSREIVCHRCGARCAVAPYARLDETACVGCVRRLAAADPYADRRPAAAIRNVAAWWDKAVVRGPGYGVVSCPHCASECIVEVGEAPRTACATCLRALGALPLLRRDLSSWQAAIPMTGYDDHDPLDEQPSQGWRAASDTGCLLFPVARP